MVKDPSTDAIARADLVSQIYFQEAHSYLTPFTDCIGVTHHPRADSGPMMLTSGSYFVFVCVWDV